MGYSPTLGRWLEQDPISNPQFYDEFIEAGGELPGLEDGFAPYPDGMNLYQCVRSNPTGLVDPSGLVGSTGGNFPGWNAPKPDGYGRPLKPIPAAPPKKPVVYVCQRPADVFGGNFAAFLGKYHQWVVIQYPDGTTYGAGLGNANGVPGAGEQTSGDLPGSPTFIKDHSGEPTNDAIAYPNADPDKVRAALELNKPMGPWDPGFNDCNTFCEKVIIDAGGKPAPPPPKQYPPLLPPNGWYSK